MSVALKDLKGKWVVRTKAIPVPLAMLDDHLIASEGSLCPMHPYDRSFMHTPSFIVDVVPEEDYFVKISANDIIRHAWDTQNLVFAAPLKRYDTGHWKEVTQLEADNAIAKKYKRYDWLRPGIEERIESAIALYKKDGSCNMMLLPKKQTLDTK